MAIMNLHSTLLLVLVLLSTIIFWTSSTNIDNRQSHLAPDVPRGEAANNNFQLVIGAVPPQYYRLLYGNYFGHTLDSRYQGSALLRAYCQNHRILRLSVINGYSTVYCIKDRTFLSQVMFQYLPSQGLTDGKISGWYAADSVLQSFGYVPVCAIHCSEGSRPVLPLGNYSRPMHDVYFSVGCVDLERNAGLRSVSYPFCTGICSDDIYEVENGKVFCTVDTQVGSTCSLHCDDEYVSVGPDTKTCGSTKQWSNSEAFKCLPPDVAYAVKNLMRNEGFSVGEALRELTKMLQKYLDDKSESSPSTRREVLTTTQQELTEAEILKVVKKIFAQLSNSSPVTLKRFSSCSVSPKERRDCGYGGIGPHECTEEKGCCFDSSIDNTIWCFHKSSDFIPLNYTTKTTTKQPHGYNSPVVHNPPTNPRHPVLIPHPEIFPSSLIHGIDEQTTPSTIQNPGQLDGNEGKCGCVPRQVIRCLSMSPLTRVLCGTTATAEQWPWHVIVTDGEEFCGGTLIAKNYVLTAAHCLLSHRGTNKYSSTHKLYLGVSDRVIKDDKSRKEIQIRTMKRVIIHPNFESKLPDHVANDIALIELSHPVVYTQTVKPLCLPGRARTTINKNCYITGFGRTSPAETSPHLLLKSARIPMTSSHICAENYSSFVFGENICAGTQQVGSADACQGDSGGPLACQAKDGDGCSWYLAGITSFGNSPCGGGTPGVYVNVSHYEHWINTHMRRYRRWST